ncbi:Putative LOC101234602 [Caligus rogercresseyi]|uniref:LOC101234602 n=1 Tax=Caligus rogercresseyi TaxID=217165 RepID=A0A7T8K7W4_CALRO|nr:Putative LOC101234602 [Caligus rogercresseyi]
METLKIRDAIPKFNGHGDVGDWIDQVDIAKDLLGLIDLSRVIPLFLEGDAFAVFKQLSEEEKKSEALIKKALKRAFSKSKFEAFAQLCTKKWEPGVSVDVYISQARALVHTIAKDGNLEDVVKVAVVAGMPPEVCSQLQAVPNIDSMPMVELAGVARGLLTKPDLQPSDQYGLLTRGIEPRQRHQRRREVRPPRPWTCFNSLLPGTGKRRGECVSASTLPSRGASASLPLRRLTINGREVMGLIDTGCTQTILGPSFINLSKRGRFPVTAFDGNVIHCDGSASVVVMLGGVSTRVECLISSKMIEGVDAIIGTDVLRHLRILIEKGEVIVRDPPAACAILEKKVEVKGRNFRAHFDGNSWNTCWDWIRPPVILNKVSQYSIPNPIRERFEGEVKRWIKSGWIIPCESRVEDGVIPLMAVVHEKKGKVRPVLDFREVNNFVECSGADADVCSEKLRSWRQWPSKCAMLDLKDAYMQVHVGKECSRHLNVRFQNKSYELQRLGFGLNCGPEIMKAIVSHVLSLDPAIQKACDHYYDDIIVNLGVVSSEKVESHLRKYGLKSKDSVPLNESRVLGLELVQTQNGLMWRRPSMGELNISGKITKRDLFSICGKLVGHFPVGGWLRTAVGFMKRCCTGTSWEDSAGELSISLLEEVISKVERDDPVRGRWNVRPGGNCELWCDASSLAYGAAIVKDGAVIEDGAWLRAKEDGDHINMAELTAVIKGVNLALKWGTTKLDIFVDSASVYSWLKSTLTRDKKIRVSGISEMLIKRRLSILRETLEEYGVNWDVSLVPSSVNKADQLTRVPRDWIIRAKNKTPLPARISYKTVKRTHELHHRGGDVTLHFAQKVDPGVTKDVVKEVIKSCEVCKSISPQPILSVGGSLSVPSNWKRVAIDITHVGSKKFLTVVDCGPSRFAIWREVNQESIPEVVKCIEEIISCMGPMHEIICDNGKTFRSQAFNSLCVKFKITLTFRCAYKPSGNGIVERNHRTIKTMIARTKAPVQECLYWYNMTPNGEESLPPSEQMFKSEWPNPFLSEDRENEECDSSSVEYATGDTVWVKPPNAKCTTKWTTGKVTGVNSRFNIEVDGTPRHISHLRPRCEDELRQKMGEDRSWKGQYEDSGRQEDARPLRNRRAPSYLNDFHLDYQI